MTDYLEEHLGNAEALLRWVRQMEQSASGLLSKTGPKENINKTNDYDRKKPFFSEKSEIVSDNKNRVYNLETEIDQNKKIVYNLDLDPENHEIREKGQNTVVNHRIESDDNSRTTEQIETSSKEENGAQPNAERAEHRVPLSAQLGELDRAVSALNERLPEGRATTRDSYTISLSRPQDLTADSAVAGVSNGTWNGSGAAARADSSYGGAPSWAEQADRMFRRDSRRYDGGFYLY